MRLPPGVQQKTRKTVAGKVRKQSDAGKRHIPIRTCRGCGRKAPKGELVRLVYRQGGIVEDHEQKMTGRGVYCCKDTGCRQRLERKKILERAFRRRF